jgi:hypothetical protein
MKKMLKSKQGKSIALALVRLLLSSLPLLFQTGPPQPPTSIKADAEWHIDGKVKFDKR